MCTNIKATETTVTILVVITSMLVCPPFVESYFPTFLELCTKNGRHLVWKMAWYSQRSTCGRARSLKVAVLCRKHSRNGGRTVGKTDTECSVTGGMKQNKS